MNDTVDASEDTLRSAGRSTSENIRVLQDAEARLRGGKIIDAVWRLGVDRIKVESDNAERLMQEAKLLEKSPRSGG